MKVEEFFKLLLNNGVPSRAEIRLVTTKNQDGLYIVNKMVDEQIEQIMLFVELPRQKT